jgi:hypothetical protein
MIVVYSEPTFQARDFLTDTTGTVLALEQGVIGLRSQSIEHLQMAVTNDGGVRGLRELMSLRIVTAAFLAMVFVPQAVILVSTKLGKGLHCVARIAQPSIGLCVVILPVSCS